MTRWAGWSRPPGGPPNDRPHFPCPNGETFVKRITPTLVAGSIALASAVVLAHGGATGVVKERMELMEGIGERMKTLSKMFKGEAPYDASTVKEAATEIRDHGGEKITALFPEGSLDEPTEALPAIWQDWARFETLSQQLAGYAGALAEAADNPLSDGGMMAQGQGMMSDGQHMMGGGQGMMMGSATAGPDSEMLATMPPDAAFMRLAQTCTSCHTKFRVENEGH